MIDDLMDEPDCNEEPDDGYIEPIENSRICVECKHPTIGESCGFCGNNLCPACFEMGGGFCSQPHTYEQICDYEDSLYGPPDAEKLKQRQAHRELVAMGVLPPP